MPLYSMYHYDMADVIFRLLDTCMYRRDHECVFYTCLAGLAWVFLPYSVKRLAIIAQYYSPAQQQKFSSKSQAPHSH